MDRSRALSPVWSGALAGLVAGFLSGIVLQQMWILTPLPLMFGRPPGVGTGWIIHLAIAVLFGIIFGAVFGAVLRGEDPRLGATLVSGAVTGAAVWAIGPLFLIPILLGLPPQFGLASRWLDVGLAYLLYGLALGGLFFLMTNKTERRV